MLYHSPLCLHFERLYISGLEDTLRDYVALPSGISPSEVLMYNFKRNFIGHTISPDIWGTLNYSPTNVTETMLDSKLDTYRYLESCGVPTPTTHFVQWIMPGSPKDSFVSRYSEDSDGPEGYTAHLISKRSVDFGSSTIKSVVFVRDVGKPWLLLTGKTPTSQHVPYLIQERLNSDPRFVSLSSKSARRAHTGLAYPTQAPTVRVLTMRSKSGKMTTRLAVKINRGDTISDTLSHRHVWMAGLDSSGYLKRAVNFKLGKVIPTDMLDIPNDLLVDVFNDIEELALKCANLVPYPLVGWDIALTDRGLVVLEGNTKPAFAGIQFAHNEGFAPLIRNMGYYIHHPETSSVNMESRRLDLKLITSLSRWYKVRKVPVLGNLLKRKVIWAEKDSLNSKLKAGDFG